MVGVAGFEPAAHWSQTSCATKLRYTPVLTTSIFYYLRGRLSRTFLMYSLSTYASHGAHKDWRGSIDIAYNEDERSVQTDFF